MKSFEILDHTADIGIAGWGISLPELFVHMAQGLFFLIADPPAISNSFETLVEGEGNDYEDLLVTWLNELLYVYDAEQVYLQGFEIEEIGQYFIKSRVMGVPLHTLSKPVKRTVKACTYYATKVEESIPGVWKAEVYFDI
ncbi:MAG: archease [Candidatus Atribacteria bacterium]|nr:archease [Candidatus Atribacteria bacterium]